MSELRPSQAAAHTEPEPPSVDGVQMPTFAALPGFSKGLHKAAAEYFVSLGGAIKPRQAKHKQKIDEAKQRGSLRTIDQMVFPDWTPELEAQAKQQLEATRINWSIPKGSFSAYMNISKAAVVLARCSPRDIVGVRTRLCFDLDGSAKKPNSPAPSPFRS
ncbi:uncharacterized protein LMH87_008242 [Akanthomyces muscarius]|uniref:Uncharacterized protein n=1 Tax=Akanthomyces muscarius TaxID=2231603 RepID=A0A9W8QIB7_AKAMU|nr:uncharacterized protein LMH87_008242 [Akanthomyces muscarius]KAJ4159337.1 hypothetical protein LMH87_008242 [Akanthomyces muscarius]